MDRYKKLGAFVGVGLVVLFWVVTPAMAQTSPNLGTAGPYAVLGANVTPTSGTVTCSDTGPGTAINGDVGTTFNAITNTGCTINGAVVAPVTAAVVSDFNAAFNSIDAANLCTGVIPTVMFSPIRSRSTKISSRTARRRFPSRFPARRAR